MNTAFYEVQRFRQWWLWVVIGLTTAGMLLFIATAFYNQIILGVPYGDKPMTDEYLIITTIACVAIMIGVVVVMYVAKLEVKVDHHGITYRFTPFIPGWRFIGKEQITEWIVKTYLPPGYGIRPGFRFTTFNTSGNVGLELRLSGKKRRLRFGTQRPEELRAAMESMFNRERE